MISVERREGYEGRADQLALLFDELKMARQKAEEPDVVAQDEDDALDKELKERAAKPKAPHVWGLTLREWCGKDMTCDADYSEEAIDEAERPDEDSAASDRAYLALARKRRSELSDELAARGVFFPPAEQMGDGYFDYLVLAGVKKRDVAELWRVVLQPEAS